MKDVSPAELIALGMRLVSDTARSQIPSEYFGNTIGSVLKATDDKTVKLKALLKSFGVSLDDSGVVSAVTSALRREHDDRLRSETMQRLQRLLSSVTIDNKCALSTEKLVAIANLLEK